MNGTKPIVKIITEHATSSIQNNDWHVLKRATFDLYLHQSNKSIDASQKKTLLKDKDGFVYVDNWLSREYLMEVSQMGLFHRRLDWEMILSALYRLNFRQLVYLR